MPADLIFHEFLPSFFLILVYDLFKLRGFCSWLGTYFLSKKIPYILRMTMSSKLPSLSFSPWRSEQQLPAGFPCAIRVDMKEEKVFLRPITSQRTSLSQRATGLLWGGAGEAGWDFEIRKAMSVSLMFFYPCLSLLPATWPVDGPALVLSQSSPGQASK